MVGRLFVEAQVVRARKRIAMQYQTKVEDDITIVSCTGKLDASCSSHFKDYLKRLIEQGTFRLIVTMEGVDFLDSSGLGALVTCLRKTRDKKGDLKIAGLSPEVRAIFEMTGLVRVFDIHPDAASAVKAFAHVR